MDMREAQVGRRVRWIQQSGGNRSTCHDDKATIIQVNVKKVRIRMEQGGLERLVHPRNIHAQ